MMKDAIVPSANELITKTKQLRETYKFDEYHNRILDIWYANSTENRDEYGNTPPYKAESLKPDTNIEVVMKALDVLAEEYRFDEYKKEVEKWSGRFWIDRSSYLSSLFLDSIVARTLTMIGGRRKCIELLANAIDNYLSDERAKTHVLRYEDLDGKEQTMNITYHEVEDTFHDDGSVECRPVNKVFGTTDFDGIFLRSYFSPDTNSWTYVPVNLIISLKTDGTEVEFQTAIPSVS